MTDTLQPNVITVNTDGSIDIVISGKIKASELDLIVGAAGSPINWTDAAGNVVVALTVNTNGELTLAGFGTTGQATVIATRNGASDFLRIGSGGNPLLSLAGSGSIVWPGGGYYSSPLQVHIPGAFGTVLGLATPASLVATGVFAPQNVAAVLAVEPDFNGGVNIYAQAIASSPPDSGAALPISYVLFGS